MTKPKYFRNGNTSHPLYATYQLMKQRCLNPNATDYDMYGGSGITISSEWLESFEQFCDDVGDRPKGATLDRIRNAEGYSKDNCRWASAKQQASNKRNTIWLAYAGVVRPVSEWSELMGIPARLIRDRVRSLKWDAEKALTTPSRFN